MTALIIISLVVFGAILLLAEIIFIPGTTLIGLLGLVFTAVGVFYAYKELEASSASLVFAGTAVINGGLLIFGFKSGMWSRFSLKDTNTSRTFDDRFVGLQVGQEGRTKSDCKPFGKAEFGDKIYEVKSEGGFLATNTPVYIYRLENNKIIIKQ
ncbi:MAG: NfeD family protein [Lunatimonas sp.]|uniref:NfeD family protein n=1 Tax=Lunatimonas sp. TaxID=2060141 RepID=UPI00263A5DBB|nr:NfeD family protein [Lunatimonas sp.]MCC5936027.1 NfeD family protein [Lunatimonas sp.]